MRYQYDDYYNIKYNEKQLNIVINALAIFSKETSVL